jgi:alanyl-tRNA synthetase
VLGTHVKQAGSLVSPERLRFDFVHFAPLTREEIEEIERLVNEQVYRNTPVQTEIRATQDAIAAGAMALFGEKYGDAVRVVSVAGFSQELCGGTHCRATGDIGPFVVAEEGGIAAGVRRIEGFTGAAAVRYVQERRHTLDDVLSRLNVGPAQVLDTLDRLQAEQKRLTREVSQLKMTAAVGGAAAESDDILTVGDVQILTRKVKGLDKTGLRDLADSLKARLGRGVVVLASAADGKVSFVVSVTPDLTALVHAGKVVKAIAPIVGGGGGGRSDFAEAGGKQPERLDALRAAARQVIQAGVVS